MKQFYLTISFALFTIVAFAQAPFVTTWKVTPESLNISIPTFGTGYDYTVDFGDGTVQTNVTGSVSHQYSNAGVYTVSITGSFPRIRFFGSGFQNKILSVEQWGDIQWHSMAQAFLFCSNLVINAIDAPDLSLVTDMTSMFGGARAMNQDINHWDVSNVIYMQGLFDSASSFNQPLDNWDVSNVTNMTYMFRSAKSFNKSLDSWDVSNVTNMDEMFFSATSFNQPLDSWDVSSVTTMYRMFMSAKSFNQSLNNWDVSSVTSMSQMFAGAINFNQPIDNWNVSNVNDMSHMFEAAFSFNQSLAGWDVSGVTTLSNMFRDATSFNQNIEIWDVSNVVDLSEMFSGAHSFNQPINNWDVSNVTNMQYMFLGIDYGIKSTFNQPLDSWDVSSVTNMMGMFHNAVAFNQPLNNWDVSSVTDMWWMFRNASAFNQPLENWDVSNVTNMMGMFHNAVAFNQPLDNWNVSNAQNLSSMFKSASTFNQNLSGWNFNENVNLTGFLDDTAMDILNYDLLLTQFNNLNLQNVTLGAKGLLYCNHATHVALISSGWTINGDGHLVNCNQTIIPGALAIRWKVTPDDLSISTPHSAIMGYNYTVDFGDGTTQSNVTNPTTHIYSQPGVYTMSISGVFPRLYFDDFLNSNQKLWSIEQWGNIQWQSMQSAFSQCSNVKINAVDAPDLSQVTDMSYMFYQATSFNQDINHWDVSNVTNMSGLFNGASAFNQPLDDWDTSNVTTLSRMFFQASSFNNSIGNWDVSQVENMESMFYFANSFNQPINNWDVSNVSNMRYMFSSARSFNQPINDWDVSSVTDMEQMFGGEYSGINMVFNQPLDNWDVSNVTNMSKMFSRAVKFNQDISNWDVSNVTNMGTMFSNAYEFNSPLNSWDVSNVTNMGAMFIEATSFNQPIDGWDVSNVTNMFKMFGTEALNQETGIAFNQPLNSWDVSNVTNMGAMFINTEEFNQPLDNWDVSNVTNMSYMFKGAKSFNESINSWNVSNVTNMSYMFNEAKSFNQPIDNWNVSNVTSMGYMFQDASVFNQSLNNWDVANVTAMPNMFFGAKMFNQNLSYWNFNPSVLIHGPGSWGLNPRFISETNMNISNYDALLMRFANLGLQNKRLGAHDLFYCNEDVRNDLITNYSWVISGDSLSPDCKFIQGTILFDQNNDGCSPEDIEVNGLIVNATDGVNNYSTFSNNGMYKIGVIGSSFTVSVVNAPSYFIVSPESATVSFSDSNQEELDFCFTANQTINDLNITLLAIGEARPGFEADYQIVVSNIGTETINNVNAVLNYNDAMQSFLMAIPEPINVTANSLSFELGDIQPFEARYIDVTMQTAPPPTVNGDDVLHFVAEVTSEVPDFTPVDNSYELDQLVVNSFDPNDKQVMQGAEVHINDVDKYLDYLIRFQNNGTASAINVRILDTLHSKLDWNTLQPISASHDYYVQITNGNQVEFIFNNINLPHEAVNEPESHGFVAYKIKPRSNVQVGDIISGDASIYFDFNAPIITNMVYTEIVEYLNISDYADSENQVNIYPNPTTKEINIQLTGGVELEKVLIYDLQGKEVREILGNITTIDVESLRAGMYFLRITTSKGTVNRSVIKK